MSCISTGESHESSYRGVCAMILRENWNTMLFPRLCTTLYPCLGELSTKNRTVGIMWGALHCIPLSASWWWLCDKDSVIQCWNYQTKTSRINLFGFHSEIFIFLWLFYGLVRNIFEGFSRFLLLSSHMGSRGNKIELKVVFVNDRLNIYTWRWKVFVWWNFVTKQ